MILQKMPRQLIFPSRFSGEKPDIPRDADGLDYDDDEKAEQAGVVCPAMRSDEVGSIHGHGREVLIPQRNDISIHF